MYERCKNCLCANCAYKGYCHTKCESGVIIEQCDKFISKEK